MQRSATAKPCSPVISTVGFVTDRPDTAVTELSVKWGPLWLVIQLGIQIRRVTSKASMSLDARPHNGGEIDGTILRYENSRTLKDIEKYFEIAGIRDSEVGVKFLQ